MKRIPKIRGPFKFFDNRRGERDRVDRSIERERTWLIGNFVQDARYVSRVGIDEDYQRWLYVVPVKGTDYWPTASDWVIDWFFSSRSFVFVVVRGRDRGAKGHEAYPSSFRRVTSPPIAHHLLSVRSFTRPIARKRTSNGLSIDNHAPFHRSCLLRSPRIPSDTVKPCCRTTLHLAQNGRSKWGFASSRAAGD